MSRRILICLLLVFGWNLMGTFSLAVDDGWMQKGVRVWYFGSAGSGTSSDAEEAYLFADINGNTAQLTHHSGINHWSLPTEETVTGSIVGKGPFWIHPQVLQTIAVGDKWMGIDITSMDRATYTYDTFKDNSEFASIPYLLLPIKALFDLQPQREIVKLVYGIQYLSDVWGTAYFDAETGLCLFNLKLTVYNTVWFILSEINYNFAAQAAFAEDNGPHTGFRSTVLKTKSAMVVSHFVQILSSVESRYGGTVQMWTTTQAGGASDSYFGRDENYCFFGSIPVLRHKLMSATPNYPPENWNAYGEYLWWWVPQGALQSSTIEIFDVSMTRSYNTFTAAGAGAGLYFSQIIFDNDGYMTDFSAKDSTIGLDLDAGTLLDQSTEVEGLDYYKNTMGTASPDAVSAPLVTTEAATSVTSSTAILNGTINPKGANTTAYFEYGTTTAYGTTATAALYSSNGSYPQSVSATVSNLQPGTTYHCRLVATNSQGTVNGGDASFNTGADSSNAGGGGGGGGGGIFGAISINDVIGYHLDGITKNGTRIYMPVTNGFKALKGAQTHIEKIAPVLAKLIRLCFDSLERRAEANKKGLLYRIGTHAFPVLGKIANFYMYAVGLQELMFNAYEDTMISVNEFNKLHQQGIAISPHVVKDLDKE
jgi:hypothetical protein